MIVSLFGTLGFAEEEFWTSCLKLLVVVMFVLIGMYVSTFPVRLAETDTNIGSVCVLLVEAQPAASTARTLVARSGATPARSRTGSRVSALCSSLLLSPLVSLSFLDRFSLHHLIISCSWYRARWSCRFRDAQPPCYHAHRCEGNFLAYRESLPAMIV